MTSSDHDTTRLRTEHLAESGPLRVATFPEIPGYEFVRALAMGGQGLVYLAVQKSTKRTVAIKLLHDDVHGSGEARRRFEREIELIAQLNHPNIVSIFDSGTAPDGRRYYVMDYVSGKPLDAFVRDARLSVEQVLRLVLQVCEAVEHAHQRGVIHRDLKPSNVIVDASGWPRVLDFGLAKRLAAPVDVLLSQSRALLGTVPYMAPEQARTDAGAVDARSDVYALGVVMYKLLTGEFPYPVSGSVVEVVRHITDSPPVPPRRRWSEGQGVFRSGTHAPLSASCPIDRDVETIALKALAKEPARRYQSVAELSRDIGQYLAGKPIEARRDSLAYVVRTRVRTGMRRSPAAACLALGVAAWAAATFVIRPLVVVWTPLDEGYQRLVYASLAPAATAEYSHVAAIALTDRTPLARLASEAGIDADCLDRDPRCVRRLHAALMKRLVAARPAALAWAMNFPSPTDYDAEFVQGVAALRAAGCEVVVSVAQWARREDGSPALSDRLSPHVRWGCSPLPVNVPWPYLPIAIQRSPGDVLPSLAASAVAAYRQPRRWADVQIDRESDSLVIVYWTESRAGTRDRRVWDEHDVLRLSQVHYTSADERNVGVRKGDAIGAILLDLTGPAQAELTAVTYDYADVLHAAPPQLRDWFEDRIVVVGDFRLADQFAEPAPGERVWIPHVHAAAIGALLGGTPLRIPGVTYFGWANLAAVLGGAVIGWTAGSRPGRRLGCAGAAAAACVVLCLLGAWGLHVLLNPLVPVAALLLGCELAAGVCRLNPGPGAGYADSATSGTR